MRLTNLIWVAQIVSHLGDILFNEGNNIGVILMISVACHLLNKEDVAEQNKGEQK